MRKKKLHVGHYQGTEAAVCKCSTKQVFLKFSQNLQENVFFPVNFSNVFMTTFLQTTSGLLLLRVALKKSKENCWENVGKTLGKRLR